MRPPWPIIAREVRILQPIHLAVVACPGDERSARGKDLRIRQPLGPFDRAKLLCRSAAHSDGAALRVAWQPSERRKRRDER